MTTRILIKLNTLTDLCIHKKNGGVYVALKEIKKVPRIDLLTPYKFNNGIVWK